MGVSPTLADGTRLVTALSGSHARRRRREEPGMKRLLIPLAALLVCGMLTASAGALPIDTNHARRVAAERYYASYGDPTAAAEPFQPAAPAAADGGTDSTLWFIAGGVLLAIASG